MCISRVETVKKHNKKTAKGVLNTIIKKHLKHEDFKNSLFNEKVLRHEGQRILQKDHELYTANVNKVSLSAFNDKLYISKDNEGNYETCCFGHYKLNKK